MRKIGIMLCVLLSVLIVGSKADVEISEENFPDNIFRHYVTTFDLNSNGWLDEDEIESVKEIILDKYIGTVYDPVIINDPYTSQSDLTVCVKGIEFFPKLNSIECSYRLESLDVSIYPELISLNIAGSRLKSLDISKNHLLSELNCGSCELTQLDVSKNPLLTKLNCSCNQLTELDVSNNTQLVQLYCNDNLIETLDVRNNSELVHINCGRNVSGW